MRFSVWAPRAEHVEIEHDGVRSAMTTADGATFEIDLDGVKRYGFSLDGGPVLPDPRSKSQPDGVHGLSATTTGFEWTDSGWQGVTLDDAVIYEMHVGTFTSAGTFDAAIERLEYLRELGITIVEVMPVASYPGDHGWGYDGVALYSVHNTYGGPDAFKRFVNACHEHHLGVMLDVVYNHLGPDGNYLPQFGPYFTDTHETLWGQAINYDSDGCDGVRKFVVDNALMWLDEYHCDGVRLDAVHAIVDESPTHILCEIATAAHQLEPRRLVVAEDARARKDIITKYGLDAVWFDDFHHGLHVRLTGENNGYYARFERSDSLITALTRDDVDSASLVVCSQNHDQIGNRALGDRLSTLISSARLKSAAALTILGPFTPLLFQGEEWGATTPFQYFTDHTDPELARAVEDGRKREFKSFGWSEDAIPSPQATETFERSKLDWNEQSVEMLDWYSSLIALRRAHSGKTTAVETGDIVTVTRPALRLVINFGDAIHTEPLDGDKVALLSEGDEHSDHVTLKPGGVVTLVQG